MPKIDPPQLVRQAQELMAESKEICERSRRAVNESKCLQKALGVSRHARHKHLRKH